MSARELVVFGNASQVPTRSRTHNGYLLCFDSHGFLFDPGEGTQRQLIFAGVPARRITRIFISHFHGDHCLGLPGIIQRLGLDEVKHPVTVHFPASGRVYFDRLKAASIFKSDVEIIAAPVESDGVIFEDEKLIVTAARLDHSVPCYGYRIEEKPSYRIDPARAKQVGLAGPQIGALIRGEEVALEGTAIRLSDIGTPRKGQSFAYVLDTRPCEGANTLAHGADMVLTETTYLDSEQELAGAYGHSTVGDAVRLAKEANVKRLVLTHFSQRYQDLDLFLEEAGKHHPDVHLAQSGVRIPLPVRD